MAKDKNPFVGHTIEEIVAHEATTYIIQIGKDLFNVRGKWLFDKKKAEFYYKKAMKALIFQIRNGEKQDRKDAARLLANLKILPLRIH